jgi:hypothetical protein
MMTDKTTITAGSLFCFSKGEYSDYGYSGHFVALEDITRERLLEIGEEVKEQHRVSQAIEDAWHAKSPAEREGDFPWAGDIHEVFIAAIIKAGLVMAVTCAELHIGSYGRLEISC